MKKTIFLSLVISLIIGSCSQEKKSPIEGTWKMVYAQYSSRAETFPDQIKGSQIKIWTKGYYAYFGHFELDTINRDTFGAGSYKLEGNRCEAARQYNANKAQIGSTGRWLIEIRNDTLIQKHPADENWNLPEKYNTEIYIRLD